MHVKIATIPTRGAKRREVRYPVARDIELRMGSWLSIRAHALNMSRGGTCVRLPGGATLGERYRAVIAANDLHTFVLDAEVRWVGPLDAAGFASVGVCWRGADARAATRLEALLQSWRGQ